MQFTENAEPKKANLFEIAQDVVQIEREYEQFLIENGGDISDEQAMEFWRERFLANESDLNSKIDGYVSRIRHLEARAEFRRAEAKPYADEAKRYRDMAKVDENEAARMKRTVLNVLRDDLNRERIETDHNKITIAKNGGSPRVVIDRTIPELLIPDEFLKSVIDEDAVAAALAAGRELEFAYIAERESHLRIS